MEASGERHPATVNLLRWLTPNEKLPEPALGIAGDCYSLACSMLGQIPADGAELSAGLRKLLEAKDCFVRAALEEASNGGR